MLHRNSLGNKYPTSFDDACFSIFELRREYIGIQTILKVSLLHHHSPHCQLHLNYQHYYQQMLKMLLKCHAILLADQSIGMMSVAQIRHGVEQG